LPVAFGLHGIGRFPFGRDMGLVLRQLVRGGVAGLGGGVGQDLITGGSGGGPLVLELFQQGHGRHLELFPT
jgi:hypothetical protein